MNDGKNVRLKTNGDVIINRYEVLQQIGRGGFAVVYRAKDTKNGSIVALKQITNYKEYALKEVQTMLELSTDPQSRRKVVELLDHFETDGTLYLILPYFKDGCLRDFIKNKANMYEDYTIAFIMTQLKSGLQYLHSKSIVHRDITTGNVLIRKITGDLSKQRVFVLLADFGLAKEIIGRVKGTTVGTRGYTHPNVFNGLDYGAEVDVYSLGCVFYSLLTRSDPPSVGGKAAYNVEEMIQTASRWKQASAVDLLRRLLDTKSPMKLRSLSTHEYMILSGVSPEDVDSAVDAPASVRSSSVCRHKSCCDCPRKENNRNGAKFSRDSAIGSNEMNQNDVKRGRRTYSNNAPRQRLAIEPQPIGRLGVNPWPLPPFGHLAPFCIIRNERRFIVTEDSIIFERMSGGFMDLVVRVTRGRKDSQFVELMYPKYERTAMPSEKDPPIETSAPYDVYKTPYLSVDATGFYNLIVKAIKMMSGRKERIEYANVLNVHHLTAKLMYNGDFRFILPDTRIFVRVFQTKEIVDQSKNKGRTMKKEEEELFLDAESLLADIDRVFERAMGKNYETQTVVGKRRTQPERQIPKVSDRYETGTFTTREPAGGTVASAPVRRRRS